MAELTNDTPLYMQIKRLIENMVLEGTIAEHDQVPSTNEMVSFYRVNHLTVMKGVNLLVDEGILYRKRGIGVFVADGAKSALQEHRRATFMETHVSPLVEEAKRLGIDTDDLMTMIKEDAHHD